MFNINNKFYISLQVISFKWFQVERLKFKKTFVLGNSNGQNVFSLCILVTVWPDFW